MNKNILAIGLIAFILIFGFSGCEYSTIDPIKSELPDSVNFAENVLPILSKDCSTSGCHVTGGVFPDLSEENAYTNLVSFYGIDTTVLPEETNFAKKISGGGSMAKYILPTELDVILLWIEQNTPE